MYFFVGLLLFLYGIIKLFICTIELYPKNTPYSNKFLLYLTDGERYKKLADYFIFIVILIFALFSIMKGLALMGFINFHLGLMLYIYANLIFGSLLLIFYSLVVYVPKVPIPKNKDNIQFYNGVGISLGLMFLIMVPFLLLLKWFNQKELWSHVMKTFVTIFILLVLCGGFVVNFLKSKEYIQLDHGIDLLAISCVSIF